MKSGRQLRPGKMPESVWRLLRNPKSARMLRSALLKRGIKTTYPDLRHTLRHLEHLGLIRCLTPGLRTGRLYLCVDQQIPKNWAHRFLNTVAGTLRGNNRSEVLRALETNQWEGGPGKTVSGIRTKLREQRSLSFNEVYRVIKALERMGLVECVGRTESSNRRLWTHTSQGREIAGAIRLLQQSDGLGKDNRDNPNQVSQGQFTDL